MAHRMNDQQAREVLAAGTHTGKLATVRADGSPHEAPVWFVLDGDDLVFTTGAHTSKGKALRRDPRTALVVDVEEPPYAFVLVQGRVSISENLDQMRPLAIRIAERYVAPELAQQVIRRTQRRGGRATGSPPSRADHRIRRHDRLNGSARLDGTVQAADQTNADRNLARVVRGCLPSVQIAPCTGVQALRGLSYESRGQDRHMRVGGKIVGVAGTAGVVYAAWVRPRLMRWGATDEEVTGPYPGADLVSDGERGATMAVTIDAAGSGLAVAGTTGRGSWRVVFLGPPGQCRSPKCPSCPPRVAEHRRRRLREVLNPPPRPRGRVAGCRA
jgi:hypothetical protein